MKELSYDLPRALNDDISEAAIPETIGVDIEVPLLYAYVLFLAVEYMYSPGAINPYIASGPDE